MTSSYVNRQEHETSFSCGLWQSLKVSVALSFISSLFVFVSANSESLAGTIGTFVGIFLWMCIITGFITLISVMIIAYPTVFILSYFNLTDEINAALVGGFVTFVTLMWMSVGEFDSFYYVIVFWGLACGYAFMKGYKNGAKE